MEPLKFQIDRVPALQIGPPANKVFLFVHGKMGRKEDAIDFSEIAVSKGYQVVSFDLPEHGERQSSEERFLPWVVIPEIQKAYAFTKNHWAHISLYAVSIGAWFSMLALQGKMIEKALFVSPIVDMDDLIHRMLQWENVTEADLEQKLEIKTSFGETLSWEYLSWVRKHPVQWNVSTAVLYAKNDDLTPQPDIQSFTASIDGQLTVMNNGEHWFHTDEQLAFLHNWEKANI